MYCAIIGDLIDSKSIEREQRKHLQKKLEALLEEINSEYMESIASRFIITLGDEFQGLLNAAWLSVDIVVKIIQALYPYRVRFGIGINEMYTDIDADKALGSDGPAYHFARSAINDQKKREHKEAFFSIRYQTKECDTGLLNTICLSLDLLTRQWTEKQRKTVFAMSKKDNNQKKVSEFLDVAPSTVTRSLKSSSYEDYIQILESLKTYFQEKYDFNLNQKDQSEQAAAYYNKGIDALKTNNLAAADNYLQKALSIRNLDLGEHHIDTAKTYYALAELYDLKKSNQISLQYAEKALRIQREILPENSPLIAATLSLISERGDCHDDK